MIGDHVEGLAEDSVSYRRGTEGRKGSSVLSAELGSDPAMRTDHGGGG